MKKILTITLSLLLLLSTTACSLNLGFNSSKYELTAGHYDVRMMCLSENMIL